MKIRSLLITAVLATAILCFGNPVKAIDNSALIVQIKSQIQALMQQITQLQIQQGITSNIPTSTPTLNQHTVKFFIDPELVQDINFTKNYLSGYVEDLNYIFSKNTTRQFKFNPEKDITITPNLQFNVSSQRKIVDNFEIWITLRKSPLGAIGGYFSFYDVDTGSAVIVVNTDEIYNNKNLSSIPFNSSSWFQSSLMGYWRGLEAMAHEIGHAMGAVEYAHLLVAQDNTEVDPLLSISFYDVNDTYWGDRKDDWSADPMVADVFDSEHYLNETREKILSKVRFSSLSSAIINGAHGFRSVDYLPDISKIKIKITDTNGTNILNSRMVMFKANRFSSSGLVLDQILTNGETTYNWPSIMDDQFILVKAYAEGYVSSVKYISVIDAQETKLFQGNNEWIVEIKLLSTNPPQSGLVYDTDSGIYMEQRVLNEINKIRTNLGVCDNCNNLPQPTISLNNGTQPAVYNLYLNNKKITKFRIPGFGVDYQNIDFKVIDNPGNVVSNEMHPVTADINGTNSIKYLIPAEGNYFQSENTILKPNQTTNINYTIVKKQGQYGSAYFIILPNDNINFTEIVNNFDNIAVTESKLAKLSNVDPYYTISLPSLFLGSFYMGEHVMTINYVGNKAVQVLGGSKKFIEVMAHEYTHGLQETLNIYQKYPGAGFMFEGMADAVAIYSGFRTWDNVGFGGVLSPGCSLTGSFDPYLGRCIFKHLDQSGYLNENFLNRLFNPLRVYDLSKCFVAGATVETALQNQGCADELNKLLSFAVGQDMTQFMKNELLANVASCTPNWQCNVWNACINGQQTRTCTDSKNCGVTTGKPVETQTCVVTETVSLTSVKIDGSNLKVKYNKNFDTCAHLLDGNNRILHTQNWFCQKGDNIEITAPLSDLPAVAVNQKVKLCNGNNYNMCSGVVSITQSCVSSWQCSVWSACTNGQQTRTCIDSNSCGVITGKPVETQTCISTKPSDINKDGKVDSDDYVIFKLNYGRTDCTVVNSYCNRSDINKDGKVDSDDYVIFKLDYGSTSLEVPQNNNNNNLASIIAVLKTIVLEIQRLLGH